MKSTGAIPALALAAIVWAVLPAPALGADVAQGEQLARQWCIGCHGTTGAGTQPGSQQVPSFRELARLKTAEQMKLFLVRPHGGMPPLTLSRAEIAALVGYIETLR